MTLFLARAAAAFAGLAATLLLAGALAHAETPAPETTREEYTLRAEPICKVNVEANRRIFKGAKAEVKAGELKKASRRFARAAVAFDRTIAQLAQVPRPRADEARLGRWLDLLRLESDYIARIGKALAAGKKAKAESLAVQLNRNSTKANNTVLGFGFDYCRIEPSRFGG
jgi:hypothetical protein